MIQFAFAPLKPLERCSIESLLLLVMSNNNRNDNSNEHNEQQPWDEMTSKQLRELALSHTDAVTSVEDVEQTLAILLLADDRYYHCYHDETSDQSSHNDDDDDVQVEEESSNSNTNTNTNEARRNPCPFNIAATLLTLNAMIIPTTLTEQSATMVVDPNGIIMAALLYSARHVCTIDPSDGSTWYLFTSVYATQLSKAILVHALQNILHFYDDLLLQDNNEQQILSSENENENAESSTKSNNTNSININIGRARASHLLASLTDEGPEATKGASAVYVRAIFDDLACDFEHRLVHVLDYSVPWLLREQLRDYMSSSSSSSHNNNTCHEIENGNWTVLDLGCGSGLVGRVFADLCWHPSEEVQILNADMTELWHQICALERSNEELRVFMNRSSIIEHHNNNKNNEQGKNDDTKSDDVDLQEIITENEAVLREKRNNLKNLRGGHKKLNITAAYYQPSLRGAMHGCDLSTEMVQLSTQTGFYHSVSSEDAATFLACFADKQERRQQATATATANLCVCADTFIYIGDVEETFRCAARVLSGGAGGLLSFSIELYDGDHPRGFVLQGSGRYAHSMGYVSDVGSRHGFEVVSMSDPFVLRKEGSADGYAAGGVLGVNCLMVYVSPQ